MNKTLHHETKVKNQRGDILGRRESTSIFQGKSLLKYRMDPLQEA